MTQEKIETLQNSMNLDAETAMGLVDAITLDLTGDGVEELLCFYNDTEHFTMIIYTYQDGFVQELWSESEYADSLYGTYTVEQNGDRTYWFYDIHGEIEDVYTYTDGSVHSAMEQGDFPRTKQTKSMQAPGQEVLLRRIRHGMRS